MSKKLKSAITGNRFKPKGRFNVQCVGKDGQVKWEQSFPNGIVDVGLHYLLDAGFNGGTQVSTWYMGLIDNAGFSALANADTMASHAGWSESTAYDEAARPEWDAGAAGTRAVTNAATTDFTMSATVTIKGIFVTTVNTKGGTTGTLWATAAFSSNASVVDGDTLKVTYTVSG